MRREHMQQQNASMLRAFACALVSALGACEPAPIDDEAIYDAPPLGVTCQPNNDGTITMDEMPFVVGARARFKIHSGSAAVAKSVVVDGVHTWDFTRPDATDLPVARLGPIAPADSWLSSFFPNADVFGPLDLESENLGALRIDESGVHLAGFGSAVEGPAQSLAVYDTSVTLYPFPLMLGARVTSLVTATNATLLGIPAAFEDLYDVEVTGRGTLVLPDLLLENTLKVTLRFERTLLSGDFRQVTHVFVHECLGEVARVRSSLAPLDEQIPDDFTDAEDIWRLAL
jgi:hypothetical protein